MTFEQIDSGYSIPPLSQNPEHTEHLFRKAMSKGNRMAFSRGSALNPGFSGICFSGKPLPQFRLCNNQSIISQRAAATTT